MEAVFNAKPVPPELPSGRPKPLHQCHSKVLKTNPLVKKACVQPVVPSSLFGGRLFNAFTELVLFAKVLITSARSPHALVQVSLCAPQTGPTILFVAAEAVMEAKVAFESVTEASMEARNTRATMLKMVDKQPGKAVMATPLRKCNASKTMGRRWWLQELQQLQLSRRW